MERNGSVNAEKGIPPGRNHFLFNERGSRGLDENLNV